MTYDWNFLLADSRTMKPIGEIVQANNRQLTVENNKSGSASTTFRMSDPLSRVIRPWKHCLITQLDAGDAYNDWYWSGPLNNVSRDFAAGTCSINAVGWFELLIARLLAADSTYTGQDAGVVAQAVLALANALSPTGITPGVLQSTQIRTATIARDTSIGQQIQNFGELEAGYDWVIQTIKARMKQLDILTRRGSVRPEIKWIFDIDYDKLHPDTQISNCKNVVENEDGSTVVNDMYARGRFATGLASDIQSQFDYGIRQEAPSLSDVVDTNILLAYANAEILYRKDPRITYQITPKNSAAASENGVSVPRLVTEFDIGDTNLLTAKRDGYEVVDQAVRNFGTTISIQNNGTTDITNLQTAAA